MSETDVLKERIDGLEKRMEQRHKENEKALELFNKDLDRRLEKETHAIAMAALEFRVRNLEAQGAKLMGIGLVIIILIQLLSVYLK